MRRSCIAVLALCLGVGLALPVAAADYDVAPPAPLFSSATCKTATADVPNLLELPGSAPEPVKLTHCNAQQSCPDGCFISCTGHTSCTVTATSVTCDGVTTNCPYPGCTPPVDCLDPCGYCDCRAAGGGAFQCSKGYCLECWPPWTC